MAASCGCLVTCQVKAFSLAKREPWSAPQCWKPETKRSAVSRAARRRRYGTSAHLLMVCFRLVTLSETRRNSSRPGSKAGSRGSSRRGSDASDFDISDIQSVCSDASETVGELARGTPRSASRQQGGRPSKIPTPQRRTTPTSKLAKGAKR